MSLNPLSWLSSLISFIVVLVIGYTLGVIFGLEWLPFILTKLGFT